MEHKVEPRLFVYCAGWKCSQKNRFIYVWNSYALYFHFISYTAYFIHWLKWKEKSWYTQGTISYKVVSSVFRVWWISLWLLINISSKNLGIPEVLLKPRAISARILEYQLSKVLVTFNGQSNRLLPTNLMSVMFEYVPLTIGLLKVEHKRLSAVEVFVHTKTC